MSTIIIGVDASERSEDAIGFANRIAAAVEATVVVANAYPFSNSPRRAADARYRRALRDDALITARNQRSKLEGFPDDRKLVRVIADTSPAKALHDLAHAEHAALLVVGSTHTGRAGRVLPGSTGERLLNGSPCSVAVVPQGYREHAGQPIRRIGVAYDGSEEAMAALTGAAALARGLGAELEVIGVATTEYFTTPALIGTETLAAVREEVEQHVQASLDAAVAGLPDGVSARTVQLTGTAAELLAARSEELDLLVVGSRGYGPLRSVLVGGVSGQLMREAHCPVIIVPRSIEAPLAALFDKSTATVA